MPSNTVEDYLKAICVLQDRDGVARTGGLAGHLNITAGSVTEMLKRLACMSPPMITYRQHRGAVLTKQGRLAAMAVIRRHRLLETFLHQVLGLGWEAVHEEAETLEHHLSERMVRVIDSHLNQPRWDPHGEPIPDASGVLGPPRGKKLSTLANGSSFRIVRVNPSMDGMLEYLDKLNLGLGTTGTVVDQAPFDGPVTLRITAGSSKRKAPISRQVAEHIYVLSQ